MASHNQGSSSVRSAFQSGMSGSRSPVAALLKCKHNAPVVYETCRKERKYGRKFFGCKFWKVNQGCGFFVWEDELDKYLLEHISILEERMEQIVREMSRMQTEMQELRNETLSSVKLEEEVTKLRTKLENEKKKRKASEAEVKALRDSMKYLQHRGSFRYGWIPFVMFVIVVVVVVVNIVG